MRKLCVCLVLLGLAGGLKASSTITVYEYMSEGNLLFDYRDISVDTYLTLVIQSDKTTTQGFSLALMQDNILLGELVARGPLVGGDWTGSHLPDAGIGAAVYDWEQADVLGYDMYTGSSPTPGNWFVIDYHPLAEGSVDIEFYDQSYSFDNPLQVITINTPEPGTLLLISSGFLAVYRRRKRIV